MVSISCHKSTIEWWPLPIVTVDVTVFTLQETTLPLLGIISHQGPLGPLGLRAHGPGPTAERAMIMLAFGAIHVRTDNECVSLL